MSLLGWECQEWIRQHLGCVQDHKSSSIATISFLSSFCGRFDGWANATMSSSEATCYMRDYLLEAGMDMGELTGLGHIRARPRS